MNLKFAAVGSSLLIAEEIKRAVLAIFCDVIDIDAWEMEHLPKNVAADLYICATTQLGKLKNIVPEEKIVCLNLHPSSTFFLEVGRLPAHSIVYIWNNHLRYAEILQAYCENLGITNLKFIPLPYDDMKKDAVLLSLRSAKYIIGVDRFINGDLLGNPEYKNALSENLLLIKAERVAALPSAAALLWAITEIIRTNLYTQLNLYKNDHSHLENLVIFAQQAVDVIQKCVNRAVCNQIAPTAIVWTESANSPEIEKNTDVTENLSNALHLLSQLEEKLAFLKTDKKNIHSVSE